MKKPLLNTLMMILGKMVSVGMSLLTTAILTRKLGLDYYGNFVLIGSMFVFLDSLADFGSKTIGIREVSKKENSEVLNEVFYLRLIMAWLAFGLGLGWIWGWEALKEIRWESVVALAMLFLTSLAGFWEIVFQSKLRMDLKVISDWFFPVGFLGFVMLWKGELSLLLVFEVYLVARAVSLGVGYLMVRKLDRFKLAKFDRVRLVRLWKMTWPMGVFLLMFATYDRAIDSMLIAHFLGSKEVGWYGLAYKIYGVLIQPANYFVSSIFPLLSNKEEKVKKIWIKSFWLLIGASGLMVIGIWLTAPLLINILGGSEFAPAVGVLRVLVVAGVFSYLGHLMGFTLISRGSQKIMLKVGIIALVINLGLNVWLIPYYGIMGAAIVTVVTEMIELLIMTWYLRGLKA